MSAPEAPTPAAAQGVLAEVAQVSAVHLGEAASDLRQTNVLLQEAIAKLTASFAGIHDAAQAQQQLVREAMGGEPPPGLGALSEQLARNVEAAITGLQFQDMTSQLIERCLTRLSGLQQMLQSAGEPAGGSGQALQALLAQRSAALTGELQKSVRQKHMESGDIELF